MRVKPTTWVVLAALILSAACGARLNKSVRAQAADAALHAGVVASAGQVQAGTASGASSASGATAVAGTGTDISGTGSGAGTGTGSGSATGTGTGPAAASGTGTGTGTPTPGAPAPAGGNGGASDTGITATTVTTGNVADLSGPVPGLFQGAVYGTDAYYAYVNSQGGIFGRQLRMLQADSQTDCTADQNAHTSLLPKVFSFVGSFELYDDCGTKVEEANPTVPDISYALGPATKANTVNRFPPQDAPAGYQNGMFCHWQQQFGASTVAKAGAIYGNIPASAFSERMIEHAASTCGWHFTDSIPVGATQTTFNAEIAKLQSDGVKVVYETATTQASVAEMKREADQQNWHPIWVTPVFYAGNSLQLLGDPKEAEGMVGSNLYSLFFSADEANNIAEVGLFQSWMQKTHPGAALDLFAMYAWASAKLFVQELKAIGPSPTRKALLDAIRSVHSYDGGGIINTNDVGAHKPGDCYVLWKIHNGQFVRYDTPTTQYRCDGQFIPYSGS